MVQIDKTKQYDINAKESFIFFINLFVICFFKYVHELAEVYQFIRHYEY